MKQIGRYSTAHVRYGWDATELPRWPLMLPFGGYLLSWVLGFGNLVWAISACCMLAILLRSRVVRFPKGFGIWLLFLMWAACSMIMIDSAARVFGASYRLVLYISATIIAVYVYNSWRNLSSRFVAGAVTCFLGMMTIAGYFAMIFPQFVLRTPMSYIVPGGLASNDLVAEMVTIRSTQWNPNAWIVTEPRPSAPFLYTNTWGNVYSIVLPIALAYLISVWEERRRRWLVLALVVASIPPALATLNRGMFVGLGIVALWYAIQTLRDGRVIPVLLGVVALAGGAAIWLALPVSQALFTRVEVSSSSADRLSLYAATFKKVMDSPLFGFGAPRPSEEPWMPSLGTQGQFWMILFSYGFIGAALFLGFFLYAFTKALRRLDVFGVAWGAVVLTTIVEIFYYGMMTGINISLLAAVMLLRVTEESRINTPPALRPSHRRSSTVLRRT